MQLAAVLLLVSVHAAGMPKTDFAAPQQRSMTLFTNTLSATAVPNSIAHVEADEAFLNALQLRKEAAAKLYNAQMLYLRAQVNVLFHIKTDQKLFSSAKAAAEKHRIGHAVALDNVQQKLASSVSFNAQQFKNAVHNQLHAYCSSRQLWLASRYLHDQLTHEMYRYAVSRIESHVFDAEYKKCEENFAAEWSCVTGAMARTRETKEALDMLQFQEHERNASDAIKQSEGIYNYMMCARRNLALSIARCNALISIYSDLNQLHRLGINWTPGILISEVTDIETSGLVAVKELLVKHFEHARDDLKSKNLLHEQNNLPTLYAGYSTDGIEKKAEVLITAFEGVRHALERGTLHSMSNADIEQMLLNITMHIEDLNVALQSTISRWKHEDIDSLVKHHEHRLLRDMISEMLAKISAAETFEALLYIFAEVSKEFTARMTKNPENTTRANTGNSEQALMADFKNILKENESLHMGISVLVIQLRQSSGMREADSISNAQPPKSAKAVMGGIEKLSAAVAEFQESVVCFAKQYCRDLDRRAQMQAFKRFESPAALLIALQEYGYW